MRGRRRFGKMTNRFNGGSQAQEQHKSGEDAAVVFGIGHVSQRKEGSGRHAFVDAHAGEEGQVFHLANEPVSLS